MKTPDNDQIENGIYKNPFQPPQFPGGASKLTDFINQNLNYPPTAKAKGIQGEVIVQLVVKENGFVDEMKILRSVDDDLDNEALRVCRMLPHFFPAKTATGKRVRTFYNVPVTFKLQETN